MGTQRSVLDFSPERGPRAAELTLERRTGLDMRSQAGLSVRGEFGGADLTRRYSTAGAVKAFIEGVRLRRLRGDQGYEYQEDVEQFFRHSPAVVREPEGS